MTPSASTDDAVTIVGAGISGIACARALQQREVPVRVLDRGRRPGGRMASRTLHGRVVDTGASYVVAGDDGFASVVREWESRGLVRPWTDTFGVADSRGIHSTARGPMRYAAAGGLRGLVDDLARGIPVHSQTTVDRAGPAETVLAMPDPQAARLLNDGELRERLGEVEWEPVVAVVLGWTSRRWAPDLHGVFVNDDPDVGFIADDGDRRGDRAAVLVVHTTAARARQHLDDPDRAIAPVVAAVGRVLGINEPPAHVFAHRWTFARPVRGREEPFAFVEGIGVCGDAWGGTPSVRTAWASGDALGRALAASLG